MIIKKCIYCSKDFRFRNAPSDVLHNGGKYCSKDCQNKNMSSVLKERGIKPKERFVGYNEKHPLWKGDSVSYSGLHYWVIRRLGRPSKCENCGDTSDRKYEWANVSKEYKRDIEDWIRLCTPCHRKFDGHAEKAWITRRAKYGQ